MNADDFAKLDTGFATRATGYGNGDVNYSGGPPNSDDYFGADNAFFNQGAPINPPAPPTPGSVVATAGGEIRGNKFWDVDGNGLRQTTEVGISGVTIFLDNNNGVFEPSARLAPPPSPTIRPRQASTKLETIPSSISPSPLTTSVKSSQRALCRPRRPS
jgi:hypothetical protein